jgi:hypothetical protein
MGGRSMASFMSDMIGHGAQGKHLPRFFMSAPLEFRQGLLAGLMDTDGSISVSNGKKKPQLMASFTSVSLRLVQETMLLAKSLGIFGRITPFTYRDKRKAWLLNFSTMDVKKYGCPGMVCAHKLAHLDNCAIDMSSNVVCGRDLVPCPASVIAAIWPHVSAAREEFESLYVVLSKARRTGRISRAAAVMLHAMLPPEAQELPEMQRYYRIIANLEVGWLQVTGITRTGIRETGFDLTVPGYETFMSVEGIVLSNTVNIHVPASPEAVEEAYRKMMPHGRNLFTPRSGTAHYKPSAEYAHGLYLATRAKPDGKPTKVFETDKQAVQAYRRGEIDIDTPVKVLRMEKDGK